MEPREKAQESAHTTQSAPQALGMGWGWGSYPNRVKYVAARPLTIHRKNTAITSGGWELDTGLQSLRGLLCGHEREAEINTAT